MALGTGQASVFNDQRRSGGGTGAGGVELAVDPVEEAGLVDPASGALASARGDPAVGEGGRGFSWDLFFTVANPALSESRGWRVRRQAG